MISVSVKAAVVRDGRVLLMSYDDYAGFHYNLPGGKVKDGESLRDAVRRKVAEETRIAVRAGRLLFVVEYVPAKWRFEFGDVQKTQYNFLAEEVGPPLEPRMSDPRDETQIGFEWVPLGDLPSRPLLPRVADTLRRSIEAPLSSPLIDEW